MEQLDYSIRLLEPKDALRISELESISGWHMPEDHLRDIIMAFPGYAWGAFLPDHGKMISK